jgi:DNA-binding XRE family transcriptional regulator
VSVKQKKERAFAYYLTDNYTQKVIAQMVDVSEKTISKWVNDDNWEEQKALKTITRKQLLKDSYEQLAAVNLRIKDVGGVPTKELYDAKSIIGKEIDRLSDNPLAAYTDVFTDFIDWLMRNKPVAMQEFSALSMQFLEHKSKTN